MSSDWPPSHDLPGTDSSPAVAITIQSPSPTDGRGQLALWDSVCPTCLRRYDDPPVMGTVTLLAAARRVQRHLESDPAVSKAKLAEIGRMVTSLSHRGVVLLDDVTDALVGEYLEEVTYRRGRPRDPSVAKRQTRRWAARAFFSTARALGLTDKAVGTDLGMPPRPSLLTRPLTDLEIRACQQAALMTLFESRAPAVLALAEAGADIGEIAAVTVQDIDLIEGTVHFQGVAGSHHRTNKLTAWGVEAIAQRIRQLERLSPETPLVVRPGTAGRSATASISKTLAQILTLAHLGDDPRAKPRSVRAWSGRRVWTETGDIVRVAIWLGISSLDTAADTIELEWKPEHG